MGSSPPAEDRAAIGDHPSAPGAPVPPPPPPPPPSFFASSSPGPAPGDDKGTRDALFAEINKGEAITAGLKKVTADMQTHKNPALRDHKPVVVHHAEHPHPAKPAAAAAPVAHAPVIELREGKKWEVEYVVGNPNVVIKADNNKQTIYVYKCQDSVIVVKGKVNSITMDSCKKTSIVFDALVGQFECINCQSIQIQTLGEMPTLSIQKTDGCQVYLSEAAKASEIVTSKSSEMNLLIPTADGDFVSFLTFFSKVSD
ncbi:DE Adenylate cyclase associated [Oesophagostomum dentatum]|uniref:DE Adenylate cyclase associated n=1 Tax=Oesophagostomum dentatum TaxID=61180 RepID=A0A0B1S1F6_OESDE|nr:DE Adenylate cyclase associated [Oesophagostomum dentatum]